MLVCLTREISQRFTECEVTHLARESIDVDLARVQHRFYEDLLSDAGARVERLPALPDAPDGVFVEDTVVVLEELAVVTRPGAESRRSETESVVPALRVYREVEFIEPPGTIDGGDILRVGRTLYVGLSSRTNLQAMEQLESIVTRLGYRVEPIEVRGCLHLKSAVTLVSPDTLLVNRGWLASLPSGDLRTVDVDPDEPAAANALWIGDVVILPANHRATAQRLDQLGINTIPIDVSEIQKAEGGVTCCCVPIEVD